MVAAVVAPQGAGSSSSTEQLLPGLSSSQPLFVLYPPPWYFLYPSRPSLSNATTSSRKSLIAALSSQTDREFCPRSTLAEEWSLPLLVPQLSYIYIKKKKLRLLIFIKLRFPGSIPGESPLAGPGAGINFTGPALWRSLMRRSCGLYPGKS